MLDLEKKRKLDDVCEDFEAMRLKAGAWWPTIEHIQEYLEPKIKENLDFALWITETANEPTTEEEKLSKKYLLRLIYDNLDVFEDEEYDEGDGADA